MIIFFVFSLKLIKLFIQCRYRNIIAYIKLYSYILYLYKYVLILLIGTSFCLLYQFNLPNYLILLKLISI